MQLNEPLNEVLCHPGFVRRNLVEAKPIGGMASQEERVLQLSHER